VVCRRRESVHEFGDRRADDGGKVVKDENAEAGREGPGLAEAKQGSHHDARVVSGDAEQVAGADLFEASQPGPSGTSGFADMSEAAFDHFTAALLQSLPF
jgi:hypothetical protein